MAKAKPETDKAADGRVRLMVRTVAAQGGAPRYRAGLGPFTRDAQMVVALPWQAEALRADPMLAVAEVEG